jgi:hypothetical protein
VKILYPQTYTESELLSRLRETRLMGFGRPLVYENATLELVRNADPQTLVPAQTYVLKQNIANILKLHETFMAVGIDLFSLTGCLYFKTDTMPEDTAPKPFIPPVVEESVEPDGRKVLLINDGMHRVYAALKLNRPLNIVLARNVNRDYPYYAYPLPHGWADVKEEDVLGKDYVKKTYRYPENYKAYFRDFNSVLDGIQEERKRIG